MKKIILILLVILVSCSKTKTEKEYLHNINSSIKAIYVAQDKSNVADLSIIFHNFLEDKKEILLNDDDIFINPIFIGKDGTTIFYKRICDFSIEFEMYNLITREVESLTEDFENSNYNLRHIDLFKYNKHLNCMVFYYLDSFYLYKIEEKTINKSKIHTLFESITSFELSDDGRYLALKSITQKDSKKTYNLLLYDSDLNNIDTLYSSKKNFELGGWSKGNKLFYSFDIIYLYDVVTKITKQITIDIDNMYITDGVLADNKIYFLGNTLSKDVLSQPSKNLFSLNLETDSLVKLSNSNWNIYNFDTYILDIDDKGN